ncbi:phage portal protein [Streptomyces cinnabarinus]|uniref:Phage portal protein n=1 Tax=Streptomyces cinnabarinus TaxID=67287 RepID=A0ABY7K6Q2_9ACTN|nr:phage portal protein [Streptomyces cinnabarinus]WAZ20175.1 phage portal protein [Streptomyces cinnabarinus]
MRNPFRRWGWTRRGAGAPEQRDIGVGDVSWPVDDLASPSALSVPGAMRLSPVFAAGRLLASSVSSLPIHQYRRVGGLTTHLPLAHLFQKPAAQGTIDDWLVRAMLSLVYRGNAVGVVTERDWLEFPTKIEWLNPSDVFVQDTNAIGTRGSATDPVWSYLGVELPSEDVVHIPWMTLPGRVWGLSPIAAYAVTVSTGLAAQKFVDDYFRAGGQPPGRFKNTMQTIDQGQASVIKRRVVQAIRSHEPIVYGKDWDYEPITISVAEAQFCETQRLTATQIAAIYGIPPEKIGGETGGSYSYSSPEQRQIELVQDALLPYLTRLQNHLSECLPRGQFIKFDADALIRVDLAGRMDAYEKGRLIGMWNIDEIRAKEDEAPLPDGKGQDWTPLPIQAGSNITVPQIRSRREDPGLHLIKTPRGNHG